MDISLFAKCLKYLLLKYDEVNVPGLGCFTAQTVAESVEEDGTPIPPYRRIAYSPAEKEDDGTFFRWLAKFLPEGSDAEREFREFIEDLSGEMDQTRCVELEGLGTLRSTGHKIYYFTCNNDLFIYPDVPGQESVSAMLPEELADEESTPIELSDEKWAREDVEGGEQQSEEDTGTNTGAAAEPEPKSKRRRSQVIDLNIDDTPEEEEAPEEPESPRNRLIGNILLILFVLLIFLMITVALFKDMPWMSNLLDHLLYTKEELEILGK